jgi:hypothetical protein
MCSSLDPGTWYKDLKASFRGNKRRDIYAFCVGEEPLPQSDRGCEANGSRAANKWPTCNAMQVLGSAVAS